MKRATYPKEGNKIVSKKKKPHMKNKKQLEAPEYNGERPVLGFQDRWSCVC